MTNQNQKTDILAVKLVPGPNGAPIGKVIRVRDVNKAIEKNVSPNFEEVAIRSVDVAFHLPVNVVFCLGSTGRIIDFANVTLIGPVLIFGTDHDGCVCSLTRAQIHAIAYFCASFRYSAE